MAVVFSSGGLGVRQGVCVWVIEHICRPLYLNVNFRGFFWCVFGCPVYKRRPIFSILQRVLILLAFY